MKFKNAIILILFCVPMMYCMEREPEEPEYKKKKTDISETGGQERIKKLSERLIAAVKKADLKAVQELLNGLSKSEQEEVINNRNALGEWALRRAVTEAWHAKNEPEKHAALLAIIQELIQRGGNVNYVDSALTRQPLLVIALINEDYNAAKLLLELGADPAIMEHPIATANRYTSEYNLPDSAQNVIRNQLNTIEQRLRFGGKNRKPLPPGPERDQLNLKLKKLQEIKKMIDDYESQRLAREKLEKEAASVEMKKREKETARLEAEKAVRPESFSIDFLKQLGRH